MLGNYNQKIFNDSRRKNNGKDRYHGRDYVKIIDPEQ